MRNSVSGAPIRTPWKIDVGEKFVWPLNCAAFTVTVGMVSVAEKIRVAFANAFSDQLRPSAAPMS